MALFLWIGSACGAILGLSHALYLYRQIAARCTTADAAGINRRGLYYAIWTFALWTIFGSYVLAFWLLGATVYALVRLILGQRAA
jgi:hypothetical protein